MTKIEFLNSNNLKSIFTLLISMCFFVSCKENEQNKNQKKSRELMAINLSKNTISNSNSKTEKDKSKCTDIVIEILESSQVYKKITKGLTEAIIKNGGTSYGIEVEGSPNFPDDNSMEYNEKYNLNIHETYSDHMPVIAHFTYNPNNGLLYQYDVANDTLISIKFDKGKLIKFNKNCK